MARCKWCGTPHSPNWITNQKGDIYCSDGCQKGATVLQNKRVSFCLIVFGSLMMLIPNFELIIYGAITLLMGIGAFVSGMEGRKYQDRKDKYKDLQLLVCEYCTQVNPPNVLRCQNCGASIESAEFLGDILPDWFPPTGPFLGFRIVKCPKCAAVYSYDGTKVDDKGMIVCQNCAKSFRL
ncbi:MAG: hypothetical protein ACW97A_11045 [Candidatus Thorarchaeota archaeon]